MRVTLTLDDKLIEKAKSMSGLQSTSTLVEEGLKALIVREAGRRLILLGGTEPQAKAPPRRRSRPK